MEDSGVLRGFEWDGADDVTALSEEDLRVRLEGLIEEERAVNYRREILLGRIDLIRAVLTERGSAAHSRELSPGDLARVLLGDTPGGGHK